jgi:non-specific serine/threonine protein kinase
LSLTGSGGVGKTRLALRLGLDVSGEFTNGVWFVDLAPLTSAALVGQSIASALGVRESRERSVQEALVEYLRDRNILLILDTCEHLVDRCAELADALLRSSGGLRILTTTREALSLPGETVYPVPALPAEESAALFVERAAAADPAFVRTAVRNAGAVAGICERLEGLPLAIELAAAQVPYFSLEQIHERLERGSFDARTRTPVARQRSLEATVAWSYELLSDSERLLLDCLSVFPGTWTIAAARHVGSGAGLPGAEVAAIQARLQSKSLVLLTPSVGKEPRYRTLEAVRTYANERLAGRDISAGVRDRHFEFFHLSYRDSGMVLTSAGQGDRLRELHAEIENLRAALDWGLSSPALSEQAVELTAGLFWFWTKRGLFEEGRRWLERAAKVPAPRVLGAHLSLGLGHMDYFQGRLADMEARNEEVLAWGREAGDEALISFALFGHALARFERGAFDEAAAFAEATRAVARGRPFGSPLLVLGNVALVQGDPDRALSHFDEAIAGLRGTGEMWGLGILLSLAAGLRTLRGDFHDAQALAAEAMAIYRDLEDPRGLAWTLDVHAALAAADGEADAAARLWGASDALLNSVGGSLLPTIGWVRERYFRETAARLGPQAFERAVAEGRATPFEQIERTPIAFP